MLTVHQLETENALTVSEVFNAPVPGKDIYANIQKVQAVVKKTQERHDIDQLDDITERPSLLKSGVNTVLEMAEMDIYELCEMVEMWQELATQMFDRLPLEDQEHFIKHLDKGILRKAYIDTIINEV